MIRDASETFGILNQIRFQPLDSLVSFRCLILLIGLVELPSCSLCFYDNIQKNEYWNYFDVTRFVAPVTQVLVVYLDCFWMLL